MNHYIRRHGAGALARRSIWLKALAFSGIGTLLTVLFLLPGCGSDSTPGVSVKGKNVKTPTSAKVTKMQAAIPLLTDTEGKGPGKMGQIKLQPESPQRSEVFPGMTAEEMQAKAATDQERFASMDMEVLPGITKKELEAKIAADQKRFEEGMEMFPGITREGLKAKIAADGERFLSQRQESFPGITLAELKAKQAAERSPDPKLMMQTMPVANHKYK